MWDDEFFEDDCEAGYMAGCYVEESTVEDPIGAFLMGMFFLAIIGAMILWIAFIVILALAVGVTALLNAFAIVCATRTSYKFYRERLSQESGILGTWGGTKAFIRESWRDCHSELQKIANFKDISNKTLEGVNATIAILPTYFVASILLALIPGLVFLAHKVADISRKAFGKATGEHSVSSADEERRQ